MAIFLPGQGMIIPDQDVEEMGLWNTGHESTCAGCEQPGEVLVCDFCPAVWHIHCLEPGLATVPEVWLPPRAHVFIASPV